MIDRKAFFAGVRRDLFGGMLSQAQVDGMNAILDGAEARAMPLEHTAYCLATAYHETGFAMQPNKEYGGPGYFFRMYDPGSPIAARAALAKSMGALPGDGVKFFGRGYVQLTWRVNYARYGIVEDPDQALKPAMAAKIMFDGMTRGVFTGKKLSDYLGGGKLDWVNARRIINGLDKAEDIARYARLFFTALRGGA